jgi:SDR family mycofactocin-dependent oxidoreductase
MASGPPAPPVLESTQCSTGNPTLKRTTPKLQFKYQTFKVKESTVEKRFEGRVALVTGAGRGQGRAEAVRFAAEGASVIAIDVCAQHESTKYPGATTEDLETTAGLIEDQGGRVVTHVVDIRDFDALQAAISKSVEELGGLHVVIANAGIVSYGRLWELSEEEFRETIDVNLIGTWHTFKAVVPHLIDQGTGGVIIATSSIAGLRGLPFLGHYVASKHAVAGMVKTLCNELNDYNIRVLSVHPAGVDTPMNNITGGGFKEYVEKFPSTGALFSSTFSPEISTVDDVASLMAFLASDEARHLNGSQISIDHGAMTR